MSGFENYPNLGPTEPLDDMVGNTIDDEDLLNFFLSTDGMGLTPDSQMHTNAKTNNRKQRGLSDLGNDIVMGGLTPDVHMHSSASTPSLLVPDSPRSSGGLHGDMGRSGIMGGIASGSASGLGGSRHMKASASSQMIASLGQVSIGNSSQFLGGGFGGFGGHLGTANEVHDPKSTRKFNNNHSANLPKSTNSMNLSGKAASANAEQSQEDAMSTEDKKKRRLARNRESARQSRKRKKQYLELLEDKVEQLTQEVNLLRQKRLEQAAKELHQQWQGKLSQLEPVADHLTAELQKMNNENGSATMQPKLQENLSNLDRELRLSKARFGPNSVEYLKILNHHFDIMKQTLLPPYTRFLLWAMDQGDEFFKGGSQRNRGRIKSQSNVTSKVIPGSSGKSGNAANLWPLVWNELGLTYEQEEQTKLTFADLNTNENINARRELVVAMNLIDRIHRVALVHGKNMQRMADRLSNVLTPSQQVRFFAWYERNRKRIHDCGLDRGLSKSGNSNNHLQGTYRLLSSSKCYVILFLFNLILTSVISLCVHRHHHRHHHHLHTLPRNLLNSCCVQNFI